VPAAVVGAVAIPAFAVVVAVVVAVDAASVAAAVAAVAAVAAAAVAAAAVAAAAAAGTVLLWLMEWFVCKLQNTSQSSILSCIFRCQHILNQTNLSNSH